MTENTDRYEFATLGEYEVAERKIRLAMLMMFWVVLGCCASVSVVVLTIAGLDRL